VLHEVLAVEVRERGFGAAGPSVVWSGDWIIWFHGAGAAPPLVGLNSNAWGKAPVMLVAGIVGPTNRHPWAGVSGTPPAPVYMPLFGITTRLPAVARFAFVKS
jgi:hypothetical protein